MNILFIHQNFPGQYVHFARHLIERGHSVLAIGQPISGHVEGVRRIEYSAATTDASVHEFTREFDAAIKNGLAVARECEALRASGFTPDVVIGHNGWGETLYVKSVWPRAPLLSYFEFFYHSKSSDLDFDPEFPPSADAEKLVQTRNAVNLLGLESADWGQTATHWQRSLYPEHSRNRISVAHEGVDTDLVAPNPTARLSFRNGVTVVADDEVITFCARSLEPYRGFHIFMRTLPKVLDALPNARVLIIGGDGVSYGRLPEGVANWRQQALLELDGAFDLTRVHFLGRVPYRQYVSILQLSTAHVYLTYPFVLSWSFVEALAAGCCVIASNTPPVAEFAIDAVNAMLVDFFDVDLLATRIIEAVRDRRHMAGLRVAARGTAIAQFDTRRVCLPEYLTLLAKITSSSV